MVYDVFDRTRKPDGPRAPSGRQSDGCEEENGSRVEKSLYFGPKSPELRRDSRNGRRRRHMDSRPIFFARVV